MQVYDLAERVRVRIARASAPDHHYDGKVGQVAGDRRSGLAAAMADTHDAYLYRVTFDDSTADEMLFCPRDLTTLPK